jgi:hypothetical protein
MSQSYFISTCRNLISLVHGRCGSARDGLAIEPELCAFGTLSSGSWTRAEALLSSTAIARTADTRSPFGLDDPRSYSVVAEGCNVFSASASITFGAPGGRDKKATVRALSTCFLGGAAGCASFLWPERRPCLSGHRRGSVALPRAKRRPGVRRHRRRHSTKLFADSGASRPLTGAAGDSVRTKRPDECDPARPIVRARFMFQQIQSAL